jgi:hypothetical protein
LIGGGINAELLTVTKSGDSVIFEERCEVRRGCSPIGTKEVDDEAGVVLFVDGERDDEEDDAGVELPLDAPDNRSKRGLRGADSEDDGFPLSLSEGGEESADESSCFSSSSSSSRPFGYAAHDDCTWYNVIGVRFSRLAASASKQKRQCSTVAMLIGADLWSWWRGEVEVVKIPEVKGVADGRAEVVVGCRLPLSLVNGGVESGRC